MIKGLIRGAAANAVLSNLLMVGIILAGLASLFSITVKNFPEIDLGAVQITVAYPGATPQEIADTILIPIEGRVRTIDGIRRITAEARTGVATVTAALERNADPREVMDDIRSAIGEITVFPSGSETPILTEVEAPELAIQYILAGDVPEADLRELAFAIRNELLALPNVSSVDLSGMPPAQIDILVSQRTLDAYGLSLRDLAGRIGNQSLDLSGGTLLSDQERVQLRTEGLAETGAEYARLPILSSESGAILTLADIAEVRDGPADTGVIARLNGQPSIFLTVNREGDQQILDLVETTRAYVTDRVRPQPAGYDPIGGMAGRGAVANWTHFRAVRECDDRGCADPRVAGRDTGGACGVLGAGRDYHSLCWLLHPDAGLWGDHQSTVALWLHPGPRGGGR